MIYRLAIVFLAFLVSPTEGRDLLGGVSQGDLLRNWALSRCIAKAFGPGKVKDDANISASAYLEEIRARPEVYEEIDSLVTQALARTASGSVKGNYNTKKCIDLYSSKALRQLIEKYVQ
ncbi:T6SS amidase immunity protein Tai4 family protein [Roseiarcus sp.]|uniref:T6SS amidase immunity protein Tai4 family protein n=1 Tax=Roseiarcus sp. TaxID=1969460 RepID=UPI003F9E6DD9